MPESTAYARRGYSGAAAPTNLASGINASQNTIDGVDLSTWTGTVTNGPARATLSDGTSEEEVEFTGIAGNTLTGVTRGVGGTSAASWSSGATLEHDSSARDFDEANKLVNAILGITGLSAGDLLYLTAAATFARLPKGTALQRLAMNLAATAPRWIDGEVFNVVEFGAVGNGIADDAPAIQAAINAAEAAGGGTVYFPVGVYLVGASVTTTNSASLVINLRGEGSDLTIIKADAALDPIVSIQTACTISGLTVDGDGVAHNGLACITNGVAISHVILDDVVCRNITTVTVDGQWVLVVWDQAETFSIDRVYLNDVVCELGTDGKDLMSVASVDKCFVNNLILRDTDRSPNFYTMHYLSIDGMHISGIPNYASFVIDAGVDYADLANVFVDSDCAEFQVLGAEAHFTNCTILGDYVRIGIIGAGTLPNTTWDGCHIRKFIFDYPGSTSIMGGSVVPLTGDSEAIAVQTQPATAFTDLKCVGVKFDPSAVTRWITNVNGSNWTDVVFADCTVPSAKNGISGLATLTRVRFHDNPGYNPLAFAGVTTPAVPASTVTATNNTGSDITAYVTGGTVTAISVGGTATGLTSGAIYVPSGSTIAITYSVVPTWKWYGY